MQFTKVIDHRCWKCDKLFFRGVFSVGIIEIKCSRCGSISLLNAFQDFPTDKDDQTYTLVYNSKGNIVLATDNASKHLGYTRNELMDLTIPEISPHNQLYETSVIPEDSALEAWESYHKRLTTKIVHLTKSGGKLILRARFHPIASMADYFTVGVYKVRKNQTPSR